MSVTYSDLDILMLSPRNQRWACNFVPPSPAASSEKAEKPSDDCADRGRKPSVVVVANHRTWKDWTTLVDELMPGYD